LVIEPDDILTQYNVACACTDLGDTDAALDLLERILPKPVKSFKSGSGTTPTRSTPQPSTVSENTGTDRGGFKRRDYVLMSFSGRADPWATR